jgi:L-lactate utilization protein LutB
MDQPIDSYWKLRLTDIKAALESNNFDVFLADNKDDARKIVLETKSFLS